MELYLNREIESYNDKEFPLEAIYYMCQQTNKWSEDTTNIEEKPETQTAPPYGKFSMVYKTRLTRTIFLIDGRCSTIGGIRLGG